MSKNNFYQELTKPYQAQMLKALKEFVAIDSVYDESTVDKENPFGKGVTAALKYIENLARNDGFIVTNYDNKIIEILTNYEEKNIAILAHADVVPVGTGWPQDPFTVLEKDGTLYGRGVADDKGPLLSAYYGLKALRDNNLLGNYQVRFLVGGNEESGSLCMEHYFHTLKKKQPTLGFSPDSAYPLTYAEKGIIGFAVRKELNFPELISLKGGVASNSVIERCEVLLKEDLNLISYFNNEGVDYSYLVKEDQMQLVFHGLAAHGSVPWMGKNAALVAIKYLGEYYKNEDFINLYRLYSDPRGAGVNADAVSENMGTNSLNVGLISIENNKLELIINYRHVETVTAEQMKNNFIEASKPFEVEVLGVSPLLFYPKDHKLIQTLLRVYQEETGDYETQIIASGGGTYAKEADNVVAFGMEYPGYDPIMHGVNEHTEISQLTESMGIYAHAIIELGKKL
ncbi:MAG: Sapep family Mn(2+)-dependent dipeptidase [Bacilli bacterium]|nr:Sapep family Mn(2+)-dependent dipeptidase [Bacilli bacterium]